MEKFNISFSGETLPGHDLEAIKKRFGAHFNINESHRVDAFFTGKEITLRRNIGKTEAAGVFVQLRQIGVVCHIERVEPEEILLATAEAEAAEAEAAATTTARPRRRRRQAGAPNLFDLQISSRAGTDAHNVSVNSTLATAPVFAAAILLLAFCLVGLRFWAESRAEPDSGLGIVAIDARQQPVIQVGDQLLFHDRAGIATKDVPLNSFGLQAGTAFDFFGNGDLLFLKREAASTLPGWLQHGSARILTRMAACCVARSTASNVVACTPVWDQWLSW